MSKLDGINPGDRVRVTFEGQIRDMSETGLTVQNINIFMSSVNGECGINTAATLDPTFQIERIEPPLKVGDVVKNVFCKNHSRSGKLAAIVNVDGQEYAIVSGFAEIPGVALLSEYVRA